MTPVLSVSDDSPRVVFCVTAIAICCPFVRPSDWSGNDGIFRIGPGAGTSNSHQFLPINRLAITVASDA